MPFFRLPAAVSGVAVLLRGEGEPTFKLAAALPPPPVRPSAPIRTHQTSFESGKTSWGGRGNDHVTIPHRHWQGSSGTSRGHVTLSGWLRCPRWPPAHSPCAPQDPRDFGRGFAVVLGGGRGSDEGAGSKITFPCAQPVSQLVGWYLSHPGPQEGGRLGAGTWGSYSPGQGAGRRQRRAGGLGEVAWRQVGCGPVWSSRSVSAHRRAGSRELSVAQRDRTACPSIRPRPAPQNCPCRIS